MIIYVMRHGTTCWNEKGITQGRTNNRLSKSGIELTKKVSNDFKNKKIDAIICSPLMRTVQTANIVNKYHYVKIFKDEKIIEIDQGIFTGRQKDTLTEEEKILKSQRSKLAKMETNEECYKRTKEFVEHLKQNYNFKNIMIITHNLNASLLEYIFKNIEPNLEDNQSLRTFKNAQIKCFKF